MATYVVLGTVRLPFERGYVEQRIYDRLSVDMIVQHRTRAYLGSLKVGKEIRLPPIRQEMRLPLTQRRVRGEG
jgi:hypothetical protein